MDRHDRQLLVVTLQVKQGDTHTSHLLNTEVVPVGQVAKHDPLRRLVAEDWRQEVQFISDPLQVEQFGVQVVHTEPLAVLTGMLPREQLSRHCPP